MDYHDIKALMDKVDGYIRQSKALLEQKDYEQLIELEKDYALLSADLQEIPADKLQMFSAEMNRFNTQLTTIRDAMIKERDAIRQQLDQAGDNSSAAKAYLKSSMVGNKNGSGQ